MQACRFCRPPADSGYAGSAAGKNGGVKLERAGPGAFELWVTAVELSSLVAAVRLAADVLEGDGRTPHEAVARLRALLGSRTTSARRRVSTVESPADRAGWASARPSGGARRARYV
jgi:hypothetical protein